jgi:hypothetical protein
MENPGASIMKNFLLSSLLLVLTCASFGAEPEVPETEAAEIQGVLIQRPDGSFLEFRVMDPGNKINCFFYDAKKKPIPPDVDRIAIRLLRNVPKMENQFMVAIPTSGLEGLGSPHFVQRPHIFRAFLSLMREGAKDPVEFYLVQYPDDLNATDPITVFESQDPDRTK